MSFTWRYGLDKTQEEEEEEEQEEEWDDLEQDLKDLDWAGAQQGGRKPLRPREATKALLKVIIPVDRPFYLNTGTDLDRDPGGVFLDMKHSFFNSSQKV